MASDWGISLQEVVKLAGQLVSARRISLLLPDDDRSILRIVASSGLPAEIIHEVRVQPGEGIAGLVLQTRQPLLVNGDHAGIRLRATTDYHSSSFISMPILFEPYGCGVINIADPIRGEAFTHEDLAHLQSFARLVARSLTVEKADRHYGGGLAEEALLQQRIEVQELERGRLARELHDEAGHVLATAIFRIDLNTRGFAPGGRAAAALKDARAAVLACAESLHDLAFSLHPRILADLGLGQALRSLVRQMEQLGLSVELAISGTLPPMSPEVKLAVFRVIQEALANIRKHAATDRAWVSLSHDQEHLQVRVEDHGIGLSSDLQAEPSRASLGMVGMRERVTLLGGSFRLISRGDGGVCIIARVPLVNSIPGTGQRPARDADDRGTTQP